MKGPSETLPDPKNLVSPKGALMSPKTPTNILYKRRTRVSGSGLKA